MNQILLRTNVESHDQQDNYSAVAVWVGAHRTPRFCTRWRKRRSFSLFVIDTGLQGIL
jgi:hypothetical protein